MIGMANPEVHDFSFGWLPVLVLLILAALMLGLKLSSSSDSKGGR